MKPKLNLLQPPDCVKGLLILDKSKFMKNLNIPLLKLIDIKISKVLPYLKKYLLKLNHFKAIQSETPNSVNVMLNPEFVTTWKDIDETDRHYLESHSITETNFCTVNYTLNYDNYKMDQIFKAVLPSDQDGMSSFSVIGHIVHVNLRDHLFPFKSLIGQVLLDKVPRSRTIVNKIDSIDNTYRNFKMELLCGDNNMMVKVKENTCTFEFDFSTVYWNPRLCTEHERIVNTLKCNDVVFDIFAGVGPFAIPAAKRKCIVFANDLNPESYKWLNRNITLNKINPNNLSSFNSDGRDFILTTLKENLIKYINNHDIHIIMNLPALAPEFLKFFTNLYSENELNQITLYPLIHVYCFAKGENYVDIAKELIYKSIGFDISDKIINIFKVRTVSNLKEMMRVTLKLDEDILINKNNPTNKRKLKEDDFHNSKKNCDGQEQKKTGEKCIQSWGFEGSETKDESKSS